jgi:hypothetical protein
MAVPSCTTGLARGVEAGDDLIDLDPDWALGTARKLIQAVGLALLAWAAVLGVGGVLLSITA